MSSEEINNLSDDYVRKMNRLLIADRALLKNLHSFKSEIIAFSVRLRETRKVSTSTKIVGAVSVVAGTALLPFTAGASSALIATGTGAILCGRLMDMIRRFVDSTETQQQMAKLRQYAKEHDTLAAELQVVIAKLENSLGANARGNVRMNPTRRTLLVMFIMLQCGLLIPTVREYVQQYVTSFLSHFPSISATTFMRFTSGLALALNCLSAVCTFIECIYEFKEILENKPHPSVVQAQSLIDAINAEVEQLMLRIELFEDLNSD